MSKLMFWDGGRSDPGFFKLDMQNYWTSCVSFCSMALQVQNGSKSIAVPQRDFIKLSKLL